MNVKSHFPDHYAGSIGQNPQYHVNDCDNTRWSSDPHDSSLPVPAPCCDISREIPSTTLAWPQHLNAQFAGNNPLLDASWIPPAAQNSSSAADSLRIAGQPDIAVQRAADYPINVGLPDHNPRFSSPRWHRFPPFLLLTNLWQRSKDLYAELRPIRQTYNQPPLLSGHHSS